MSLFASSIDDISFSNLLVLQNAVAGLVLSKQIAISSQDVTPGAKLPPSMIRLPTGHIAYINTLVTKLFQAADDLRGVESRGERFKSRLSAIVATAATASNIRTVASGYDMTEGTMLEVLSDVAVQVKGDAAGQKWYLGRVMVIQHMPGKSWQNRLHPVDLLSSPEKVRVRCEWYHRSLAGDRTTFYFGDHPTDTTLSAPLDAAWYSGESIIALVIPEYDAVAETFSVDATRCADFDKSASTQPETAKVVKRKRATTASSAVDGARKPARDDRGRADRAGKRSKTGDRAASMAVAGKKRSTTTTEDASKKKRGKSSTNTTSK